MAKQLKTGSRTVVANYDPNQARDAEGQWAEEGSEGAGEGNYKRLSPTEKKAYDRDHRAASSGGKPRVGEARTDTERMRDAATSKGERAELEKRVLKEKGGGGGPGGMGSSSSESKDPRRVDAVGRGGGASSRMPHTQTSARAAFKGMAAISAKYDSENKEWQIKPKGGSEKDTYHTTDHDDAVSTALDMSERSSQRPPLPTGSKSVKAETGGGSKATDKFNDRLNKSFATSFGASGTTPGEKFNSRLNATGSKAAKPAPRTASPRMARKPPWHD
jgi:hypothetical protein